MYQFDTPVIRQGTGCLKWDRLAEHFGQEGDLLPMWVADMEFQAAPAILQAVERRAAHGVFGYDALSPAYYDAVIHWMARRHQYTVRREWITVTPGVVTALCFAVQAVSIPGDEILIPTPVYGPFFRVVEDHGRRVISCPLIRRQGRLTFDLDAMERAVTPRTRALLLCSPHNPGGRVWDRDELEEVADFCRRHNLTVIDDEIHHDLVFHKKHIVFPTLSADAASRTILCTAPSKTFNLAGLEASNIIIENPAVRARFRDLIQRYHITLPNSFVDCAVQAAYDQSEAWLDAMLDYVEGNITLFTDTLRQALPQLQAEAPEGTYLVWVDFRALGDPDTCRRLLLERCRVAPNDGREFGPEGAGFFRFNLACPRSYISEALNRMCTGLKT